MFFRENYLRDSKEQIIRRKHTRHQAEPDGGTEGVQFALELFQEFMVEVRHCVKRDKAYAQCLVALCA